MFRRFRGMALCAALALFGLAGCNDGGQMTDGRLAGRDPETKSKIGQGVVSLDPGATEIIYAVGEGSRLTAVSSDCDFPEEAAQLPTVGTAESPDMEKLDDLAPGLVITNGEVAPVEAWGEQTKSPVFNVPMSNLEELYFGVYKIGAFLNAKERAEALRNEMRQRMGLLLDKVKDLPKPKVLVVVGRTDVGLRGLVTIGGNHLFSEVIAHAGGQNIYATALKPTLEVQLDKVVEEGVEIILELHPGEKLSEADLLAFQSDWRELPDLPAVAGGRIHFITDSHVLRPGPRVPKMAEELAKLFHGEAL